VYKRQTQERILLIRCCGTQSFVEPTLRTAVSSL
jgi:hypothetical protein